MDIVGKKIVKVRLMSKAEMEQKGWAFGEGIAIELDDGTVLYPSQDEEGNGPGALFGVKHHLQFHVTGR